MSKLEDVHKVNYNGIDYVVCKMKYKNHVVPIVLDNDIYDKIIQLNKTWNINDKGIITTSHTIHNNEGSITREIYLHDVVMKMYDENDNKPILHINKLGIDNRRSNLIYDTDNKNITKNLKKKLRTISLPRSSGIHPDDIPSYVWYLKEDDTHGERFMIKLGNSCWKSTGSKKMSTKYKLEETKKYLRFLREKMGDAFCSFSMNGDLNNEGRSLLDSFIKISSLAKFENMNSKFIGTENTNKYLKEDHNGLTNEEIQLLQSFNPSEGRLNFR